jgi:hypothetical protein
MLQQCKRFCLQEAFITACNCSYPTYTDLTLVQYPVCNLSASSENFFAMDRLFLFFPL